MCHVYSKLEISDPDEHVAHCSQMECAARHDQKMEENNDNNNDDNNNDDNNNDDDNNDDNNNDGNNDDDQICRVAQHFVACLEICTQKQ